MAPAKATEWPESIYEDPDVLTLDENGKFILCRVCAESYATRKGKKPKPVVMNACYRTRAWETHKVRTRAHRLQRHTVAVHTSNRTDLSSPQAVAPASLSPRAPLFAPTERLEERQLGFEAQYLTNLQPALQTGQGRIVTPNLSSKHEYDAVSPLVFPLSRYSTRATQNAEVASESRVHMSYTTKPTRAVTVRYERLNGLLWIMKRFIRLHFIGAHQPPQL